MHRSIDDKKRSIMALRALLEEIIKTPHKFGTADEIVIALFSQGKLAKYRDIERQIYAMSLNTFKQAAGITINGGHAEMDCLRKKALAALSELSSQPRNHSRGSKNDLEEKLRIANSKIRMLEEELFIMSSLLSQALDHGKSYAADAPSSTMERCKRDREALLSMIDLLELRKSARGEKCPSPNSTH